MIPRRWQDWTAAGLLAVVYLAAGKLGLSLATLHENVSLVWPPTGIALAALLRFGYRLWPGIFLGAFFVNILTTATLLTTIGIAAGNTLEALIGAWLLLRFVGFRPTLERLKDVLGMIFVGGTLATTVSATIGVTSLSLGGSASWDAYSTLWWQWWIGDMLGALVVAPFLLTWSHPLPILSQARPLRVVEASALILSLMVVGQAVFGEWLHAQVGQYPPVYFLFPLLIWTAIRFGPAGSTTITFVLSCIAVWGTVRGFGPFGGGTPEEGLIFLQSFLAVVVLTTLVLTATINERKRAEEELKKANEELLRLSEIKSEFASMVSHELRTPLSSIKEGIDLVLDEIDGPITTGHRENLAIAKNNVDRLARLINNVLDYSKLESGKMEMSFKKTSLNELIRETYDLMTLAMKNKKIDFQKEVPEKPLLAVCDSDKIKQVIINLIDNAIKFTDENGRIRLRLGRSDHQIRIEVEDNGIGIKKEDQEKIFEMFGQASSRRKTKRHGSGVGLAICKLIVDQHKGEISVESTPGQGSKFTVMFPDSLNIDHL